MLVKKYPELHCDAQFVTDFLSPIQADDLFSRLQKDFFFNKKFRESQPHHVRIPNMDKIMFMDQELFECNALPSELWGKTSPWFTHLKAVREEVQKLTNIPFHTCVALYYSNGNSWVDFHTDYPAFGSTEVIASLSLGVQRSFHLREKQSKKVYEEQLSHGSLFIMGKGFQENYEHSLRPDIHCSEPRINLTFRTYGNHDLPRQN